MASDVRSDSQGAPASNAGDRFHELWALKKALSLVSPAPTYHAMTVEGVPFEDSVAKEGNWDAVDVCLLSGGETLKEATSAIFSQLKYSTTAPNANWTVSRLCKSDSKTGNNSPIRKLADSFKAAEAAKESGNTNLQYKIQLVSNQPVSSEVLLLCGKEPSSHRVVANADTKETGTDNEKKEKLRAATGLTKAKFAKFCELLDFTECGSGPLLEQEAQAIFALEKLIVGDSRYPYLELLEYISNEMMPDRSKTPITETTILARLGVSSIDAIYPCPSRISTLASAVRRQSMKDAAEKLNGGVQHLLVHGGAGCGKTTTISMLGEYLPPGSISIVYDCYGGGSYLDGSNPRHRPQEAFTQLSNEIASRVGVPRLLRVLEEDDAIKAFRQRLFQAADILKQSNPAGILMVVVDAADNAVAAAQRSGDKCFVHGFVTLQGLPSNIRLVVSARTVRRDQLKLPPNFAQSEIFPFTLTETTEYLKLKCFDHDEPWISELHRLTGGVPRILSYAIELAGGPDTAISFLLPEGKDLSEIFELTVRKAWERGGGDENTIDVMCAALIALPRPVPLEELAYAIDLSTEIARDLCADLYPTLRTDTQLVSFADEDFEDYVVARGQHKLAQVRSRIAHRMLNTAESEPYAARHVVSLLIDAGMEREALQEAMKDPSDTLFPDPVVRRLCQLERMHSALRLCSRTGNGSEALSILLIGAEALRTSDAITSMLTNNMSLATRFSRDAVEKLILWSPRQFSSQGPVLCHCMAEEAREGQTSRVDASRRKLRAWQDAMHDERNHRGASNQFTDADVAAYCYAQLTVGGIEALDNVLTRLEDNRHDALIALVDHLLSESAVPLLAELLSLPNLSVAQRVHVISRLSRLGEAVEEETISSLLCSLSSAGLLNILRAEESSESETLQRDALELYEYLLHRNYSTDKLLLLLAAWSESATGQRPTQNYQRRQTSLFLKIECLLATLQEREIAAHDFLGMKSPPAANWTSNSAISKEEHSRQTELHRYYSAVLPFYVSRATFIITGNLDNFLGAGGEDWKQKLRSHVRYENRHDTYAIARNIVRSIATTAAICQDLTVELFEHIRTLIDSEDYRFSAEDICSILQPFTWRKPSHGPLTAYANGWLEKIPSEKISSSSKADFYLAFAKLLLTVSPQTASFFYSKAFVVLEEIDYHEIYLLGIFDRLTSAAKSAISADESRTAAFALASFGSDVAVKLENYDDFPWKRISRAVARLNIPVGLALASRWEDDGRGIETEVLQVILEEGLENGEIPASYATSARYLSERTNESFVPAIISSASHEEKQDQIVIREMLAECEALLNTSAPKLEQDDYLVTMSPAIPLQRWSLYIKERANFLRGLPDPLDDEPSSIDHSSNSERQRAELIESLDWDTYVFDSAKKISDFVSAALTKGRTLHSYFYLDGNIYQRIRRKIAANHQIEFLKYLAESILEPNSDLVLAEVMADTVAEWIGISPVVQEWCTANIPTLISKCLFTFSIKMVGKSPVEKLIDSACITNEKFYKALLNGLSEIENLDARLAYELIETIARVIPSDEVNTALNGYLARLLSRTNPADRLDLDDLPTSIPEAFARLLYASLGDIFLPARWRTAHAIRALFALKRSDVIDQLVARYSRHDEISFRTKDAPFYWAAARLWLIIAISRACDDNPGFAARYKDFLLSVLTDTAFPHLLVRKFAQKALERLSTYQVIELSGPQARLVRDAFKSPFRKTNRPQELDRPQRGRGADAVTRRFHFDGMDTLRYWYPGRAELFSDVSLSQFTDEAERWIVDEWGITDAQSAWNWEPRRHRIERHGGASLHSHGSIPKVERFTTHLEWHAMWCAVGSLMATHPLNKGRWAENLLEEEFKLSTVCRMPTTWLSDLRAPKPLQKRFWAAPKLEKPWVSAPDTDDVLSILGLDKKDSWLLANGSFDCYWKNYQEHVHVSSCLVSQNTSRALLRALQSSDDIHGHYLPTGSGGNISESPFMLESWLASTEGNEGLDEHDDFGQNISAKSIRPDDSVLALCGLMPSAQYEFSWHDAVTEELAFYSEKWTEQIPERRHYGDWSWVRSSGEQLHCKRYILDTVLKKTQRNLIVKIHTHRKKDENKIEREDEEGQYFNTYVLLTSDGAIETVEGPVGTWKTSSPRDKS
jgi:hypothetical protein